MNIETLIPGILLIGLGLLFFFNNKNIAKGACQFYQKIYTEHNLKFMFKVCGAILVFGGLVLILRVFFW